MIIYDSSNVPIIDIDVDDTSYRYRALMREDTLTLEFSLAEHVELPVGAYCTFEAQVYTLMSYTNVTIRHRRDYEYRVTMLSPMSRTQNYIIYNPIDKRLRFDLTATPQEHLQLIVDNLNARDGGGWTVGSYVSAEPRTISYNHSTCWDGIVQLAGVFETEFEFKGMQVNLGKVEYHKDSPLSLSYGKGNGLRPGINRISASMPIGKVYVQGGDRNIGLDNYDAKTLHLPKGITFRFDGEDFVSSGGVLMHTNSEGSAVYLDSAPTNATESSLDLSDIYPKREGTISDIVFEYKKEFFDSYSALIAEYPNLTEEDWYEVYVHFCDDSIPATLDFDACLMGNDEPLTVIFQSGSLVGREFNVTFTKTAKTKTIDGQEVTQIPADRFEIEHASIDGIDMPAANFRPSVGDKYAIFNCALPQEYINAGTSSKEGAEWDMLKEAAKYLYENREPRVAYRGDLDPIFAKGDWANVGDYLKCGSYISFSDPEVQSEPVLVRIVGVRQYVNNPSAPTIEFSNDVVNPTLSSVLQQLENAEAKIEAQIADSRRYAARSFRNAKETMSMLIDAKLSGFTDAISPIAVQTMQLIAGDESLQFKFWADASCTVPINPVHAFDKSAKTVTIDHAYLQHMTLGIDTITPPAGRQLSDYKVWELQEHTSAVMSDPEASYYVYAKCDALNDGATHNTGQYVFSETAIGMEEALVKNGDTITGGYYHFLIGILNSEVDGDRDFASMYGFTEVLPGQITTDKIRSTDGYSWFDMVLNQMRFGDANISFSWNLNNSHEFLVDGGTIRVKSRGSNNASIITCDRGAWVEGTTYYYGDEVYTADGARYVYINSTASTVAPPNSTYWQLKQIAGSNGYNTAIVYLYKRAATAPSIDWVTGLTYSFTNKALTSVPSGWSQTIPAFEDNKPLYVTAATAMSRENTDTIAYTEWSSPVELNKDGKDGLNSATVFLYQRGANAPSKPSATLTYTFATGILSGTGSSPLAGWSQSIPSGTDPCWVIQATAVSSDTSDTIAASEWSAVTKFVENGQRGSAGAKLRGPTPWNNTSSYESGKTTDFQDIVYYVDGNGDAQYFLCIEDVPAATESNPNSDPVTDTTHWQKGSHFDFVASDVSMSLRAKIVDLNVNKLTTENPKDKYAIINIAGNQMNIANSNGENKVTITSGTLPSGGEASADYSLLESNNPLTTTINTTAATDSGVIEVNVGSVSISHENNRVAIPSLSVTLNYTSTSVTGGINATCSLWAGDTCLFSHPLSAGTGHTSHSAQDLARTITLPVTASNSPHIIKFIIDYSTTGASAVSGTVVLTRGSTARTVTYPAEFTMIATNGAQFRYGSNGFKIAENEGAKVIQNGIEYNMAGIGALNDLTAPKRIMFCTTYPDPMSSDVFYIKVEQSS